MVMFLPDSFRSFAKMALAFSLADHSVLPQPFSSWTLASHDTPLDVLLEGVSA